MSVYKRGPHGEHNTGGMDNTEEHVAGRGCPGSGPLDPRIFFASVTDSRLLDRPEQITVGDLEWGGSGPVAHQLCVLCLQVAEQRISQGAFAAKPTVWQGRSLRRQCQHLQARHPFISRHVPERPEGRRAALGPAIEGPGSGQVQVSPQARVEDALVRALWSPTTDAGVAIRTAEASAAVEHGLQKIFHAAVTDKTQHISSARHGSCAAMINIVRGHFTADDIRQLTQLLFQNSSPHLRQLAVSELMRLGVAARTLPHLSVFHGGPLIQSGCGNTALVRACALLNRHVSATTRRNLALCCIMPDGWLLTQRVDAVTWSAYNNVAERNRSGGKISVTERRRYGGRNVLRLSDQDFTDFQHAIPGLGAVVSAVCTHAAAEDPANCSLFNVHLLQQEAGFTGALSDCSHAGLGVMDWHADTGVAESDGEGSVVRRTYIVLASQTERAPGVHVAGLAPRGFVGRGSWISMRADLQHRSHVFKGDCTLHAPRELSLKIVVKLAASGTVT